MVRAVQEFADGCFATADNPRGEPLAQIFGDMRAGVTATAAGVAAFIVTGWPVAAPFTVLAVLGLRGLGGRTAGHVIEKLEAIAKRRNTIRKTISFPLARYSAAQPASRSV